MRQVLIIEDEFLLADELAEAIEKGGGGVVGPAATVADALRLIDSAPRIDVAIMDIVLRGEQGFIVADALTGRGIPFVFASGLDSSFIPDRFAGTPRFDKPNDLAKVVETLLMIPTSGPLRPVPQRTQTVGVAASDGKGGTKQRDH